MSKINWKQKLSSRKFWGAVTGVVISCFVAFGADEETITKVTGIISSVGILAIYILAEAHIDANRE